MNRIQQIGKKQLLVFISIWLGITILLTLWPFNFADKNSVSIPADGGLHFESPSVAYLDQIPVKVNELDKFSIVLDAKSNVTFTKKSGVIFGYCLDYKNNNFLMVQAGNDIGFVITADAIPHHIWARDIFEKDKSVRISITFDGEKLAFLKNGSIRNVIKTGSLDFSYWDKSFPLTFANSGDGTMPWSGTIYSFNVFDDVADVSEYRQLELLKQRTPPVISLSFEQNQMESNKLQKNSSIRSLIIPASFSPPVKNLLYSIKNIPGLRQIYLSDILLNILLFIPSGLFLRALLEKYIIPYYLNLLATIGFGLLITISIESFQSFLPIRYPSMIDVISNTLGTIIGFFFISSLKISRIKRAPMRVNV